MDFIDLFLAMMLLTMIGIEDPARAERWAPPQPWTDKIGSPHVPGGGWGPLQIDVQP